MFMLLFFFRHSIVLAFVIVLRSVCTTNVGGFTEIFPRVLLKLRKQGFLRAVTAGNWLC